MDLSLILQNNGTSVVVFCLTLLLVYIHTRRRKSVPPGPPCWPIIGNLGSLLGKDTLENLESLREKYGDICGIYIGSELNIVLSGYDVIHGTLLKKGSLFSRRPTNTYTKRTQKYVAVVLGNDEIWKEQRTFTLNTLKEICFRKSGYNLERRINDELMHFVNHLLQIDDELDISDIVTLSFANVIYTVLHGHRIGYTDERFLWYQKSLDDSFQRFVKVQVLHYCFPFLHYLPGDLRLEEFTVTYIKELKQYFYEICRTNYENYEEGNENCFVDFWITAGMSNNMFREDNLWIVLHDLMAAGSETTATTLKWIILAMIKNPNIQRKLQRQVDSVLPNGQTPSSADRESLPYVEATVLEGLRFGSPVPLSLPHAVSQDTVYNGFLIPKDATILPNIASVHRDPSIYPDPEIFRPERFLDESETRVVGTEKLIPFSLGPRSCAGETVARIELFLYLTTLVQKVEFQPPLDDSLPSMKGTFGLTYRPQKYEVRISKREK